MVLTCGTKFVPVTPVYHDSIVFPPISVRHCNFADVYSYFSDHEHKRDLDGDIFTARHQVVGISKDDC
jgi:hypothetical protein